MTKTGERLAIANALRNARTEELPSSSASQGLNMSRLEAIREYHFAEDLPIDETMLQWTEAQADTFFASGGLERPAAAPRWRRQRD